MTPIKFQGCNCVMVRPESMTEEECADIHAMKFINEENQMFIITAWQPSAQDLVELNAGKPVYLQVYGGMPPVSLYTIDDEDKPHV